MIEVEALTLEDIKIGSMVESIAYDPEGRPFPVYVIIYTVEDLPPRVITIPKEEYSPHRLLEEVKEDLKKFLPERRG